MHNHRALSNGTDTYCAECGEVLILTPTNELVVLDSAEGRAAQQHYGVRATPAPLAASTATVVASRPADSVFVVLGDHVTNATLSADLPLDVAEDFARILLEAVAAKRSEAEAKDEPADDEDAIRAETVEACRIAYRSPAKHERLRDARLRWMDAAKDRFGYTQQQAEAAWQSLRNIGHKRANT